MGRSRKDKNAKVLSRQSDSSAAENIENIPPPARSRRPIVHTIEPNQLPADPKVQYTCSRKSDDNTITIRRAIDEVVERTDTQRQWEEELDKLMEEIGDETAGNSGIGDALVRAADILNNLHISPSKPNACADAAAVNADELSVAVSPITAANELHDWTLLAESTVIEMEGEAAARNTVYMTDRDLNRFIKAGKIRFRNGSLYYVD